MAMIGTIILCCLTIAVVSMVIWVGFTTEWDEGKKRKREQGEWK